LPRKDITISKEEQLETASKGPPGTISSKVNMKFITLDIPAAGTWKRDCELVAFNKYPLSLEFIKDSDSTKWKITFDDFIAFKVTSEEFTAHLENVPIEGAFYIIENSPWLENLRTLDKDVLNKCKHYLMFFYDDVFEVVSKDMICEMIK